MTELPASPEEVEKLTAELRSARSRMVEQIGKSIIGQEEVIEQVLLALFCEGHALLVGVPGLAKTLLVSTISRTLDLQFGRIQFTPDLMPSDITGTEVIEEDRSTGRRQLRFVRGPVFTNVLLADEINRTPPKTQAALLEAMQEHQVTASGEKHTLPRPFFVLATQNPIEQEGTYPLPEAQLDRFMFEIRVSYPTEDQELEIVRRTTSQKKVEIQPVLSAEQVLRIQQVVRLVPAADHVIRYALRLVRATRVGESGAQRPGFIDRYVSWGAGPRASQNLVLAAKARAIMDGRTHVEVQDIQAIAHPVLRHRIITSFSADADHITPDDVIARLLEETPVEEGRNRQGEYEQVLRN